MNWLNFFVFLLFIIPIESRADVTGSELLTRCKGVIEVIDTGKTLVHDVKLGRCAALVRGIRDLNNLYLATMTVREPPYFCIPDEVTHLQLIRVLVKFLDDNPEKLHMPQVVLVWEAFFTAFPCKER